MSNVIYNDSTQESPQENLPPLSNQQLHDMVSDLFTEYRTLKRETGAGTTVEARIDACKDVIGLSYRHNGRKPSVSVLDRLGTYLDFDYYSSMDTYKASTDDYPALSLSQLIRRRDREQTLQNVYTGKNDTIIGRTRGEDGQKTVIYDYMTPEKDNALVSPDVLALYDALNNAKLTKRQREAIDLTFFGGMTQEDAAEIMGIHQPNVKAYIDAGIRKLRNSSLKTDGN